MWSLQFMQRFILFYSKFTCPFYFGLYVIILSSYVLPKNDGFPFTSSVVSLFHGGDLEFHCGDTR